MKHTKHYLRSRIHANIVMTLALAAAVGGFVYHWHADAQSGALTAAAEIAAPVPPVIAALPPSPANAPEDKPLTILAFGDMMLDRGVREKIDANGQEYPFALIESFLTGYDIVVANAEGVFTSHPSMTENVPNAPLAFAFDPAELPTLKSLGFTLFSQANNHALNFGTAGLHESEQAIDTAGLDWFGDPSNVDVHPYVTTIRGVAVAFIGYHQFAPGGFDNVLDAIRSAKADGEFVIVYPHWGVEYSPSMTNIQVDDAHAFVDAGADAVLGGHPHVIEPVEIYKGKAIFYSMGNFIFDQAQTGPTSQGLSIGISISSSTVSYLLFPIDIKKEQASLMGSDERAKVLGALASTSVADPDIQASIAHGGFELGR